jgi:hypothetical protein
MQFSLDPYPCGRSAVRGQNWTNLQYATATDIPLLEMYHISNAYQINRTLKLTRMTKTTTTKTLTTTRHKKEPTTKKFADQVVKGKCQKVMDMQSPGLCMPELQKGEVM